MVTLTQLEYLVAVARHGTFSQAAKACFVTQPTLSMQIHKLEDELGVLVFDRASQPVRATAIGQRIIEQATIVLSQAALIPAIVSEARDTLEGSLRLGVIPTLAPYVLPLFLDPFCRAHPKVRLHVEETKTDDILAALRKDALDVGLLATPLGEPLIEEHPLFLEPFYVYVPKDSALVSREPIADADLEGERMLLLTEGHCLRTQMLRACNAQRAAARDQTSGFDFESGSLETLCRLVEQGLGYTVLPHLARASTTRSGRALAFAEPRPSRQVSLCVHASFARRALLAALARSIVESLPAELRKTTPGLKTIALR